MSEILVYCPRCGVSRDSDRTNCGACGSSLLPMPGFEKAWLAINDLTPAAPPLMTGPRKLYKREITLLQRMANGSELRQRRHSDNYILVDSDHHHSNIKWSVIENLKLSGHIGTDNRLTEQCRAALKAVSRA